MIFSHLIPRVRVASIAAILLALTSFPSVTSVDAAVVPNSTGGNNNGNNGASNESSPMNTSKWIDDDWKSCDTNLLVPLPKGAVCFYGEYRLIGQTCATPCYWGGLCKSNRCTRQLGDCSDCPSESECEYGFCVKTKAVATFLQDISPYLYTTNALIQPASPATQPLYIAPGQTVDPSAYSVGVGGSITPYYTAAAAAREVGVSLMAALAVFAIGTLYAM